MVVREGLCQDKESISDAFLTAWVGRRGQGKGSCPTASPPSSGEGKDRMLGKRLIKDKTFKRPLTWGYSLALKWLN